jgi:hypothetical protein
MVYSEIVHVVGFYYIVFSLYVKELIFKIFTVLNSIEISQGGSNTDNGSKKEV